MPVRDRTECGGICAVPGVGLEWHVWPIPNHGHAQPGKPARLHEQLNDVLYDRPGGPSREWVSRASWYDPSQTLVKLDGLLDGWVPLGHSVSTQDRRRRGHAFSILRRLTTRST